MAENVLSVSIQFVENHRYRFPSEDPASWVPTTDAARKPLSNRFVYVFQALGPAPFLLLKACRILASGAIADVSAEDALAGRFPRATGSQATQLPAGATEQQSRWPDTVQQQRVRYFFYASRTVLDPSFVLELAANPPPELKTVTLDGTGPQTVGV